MQVLVIFACMVACISAQRSQYRVSNYPDPIRRYEACGRSRPSFICDPTNILPVNAGKINILKV